RRANRPASSHGGSRSVCEGQILIRFFRTARRSKMSSTTELSFKKIFDLSGRVALVTGAASGFGEVISLAFAEYGCDVACADMNILGVRETAAKVAALGRRSAALHVELGEPDEVEHMVSEAVSAVGTFVILV